MKILITGFEPFGGEKINPALEALRKLPKVIKEAEINVAEIPTVFDKSAEVLKEIVVAYQPDYVLLVGQAGGRCGITPERIAINLDDARIPDNEGNQPIDQIIQSKGDAAYFSQHPVKAMVKAIQNAGLPASLSNSAGTFVCNHLMYQGLYMGETEFPQVKFGFIHVPYLPEQVVDKVNVASMSLSNIATGLRAAIETLVDYHGKNDVEMVGGEIA